MPVAASHDDDLAPQPGQRPPGRGEDDAAQVPVRCHRRGRANRVRARDGGQEDAWLDGKPSRRWKRAGLERYRHRARVRRFLHLRGVVKYPSTDQKFISEANATRELEAAMLKLSTDLIIISGLEEGEKVVTGGFVAISRELYDGAPVKIREKSKNNSRSSRNRD